MPSKRSRRMRARATERASVGAPVGDADESAAAMEPVADLTAPSEPESADHGARPTSSGDARLTEVDRLEAAGQLHAAVDALRALLLDDPSQASLRFRLGRLYDRLGDHLLALEQLEAARARREDDVDVLVSLGGTLVALGRYDQAEREVRRALRLDPERSDVHANLGILHFKRGLYSQAELELRRATELDPGSAVALFYRGEALNQLGKVDEALEMLQRAVALDRHNAKAFYTMGILYDKKNLRRQAEAMYRKAREVATP